MEPNHRPVASPDEFWILFTALGAENSAYDNCQGWLNVMPLFASFTAFTVNKIHIIREAIESHTEHANLKTGEIRRRRQ